MEKDKICLLITLPAHLSDLPIRIVQGDGQELLCSLSNNNEPTSVPEPPMGKHVFVWNQGVYTMLLTEDIVWLEADGSYTVLHLTDKRKMTLSFPLVSAQRVLPDSDFIRIHRSIIVNIRHIIYMIGNSLKVDDNMLSIGRDYRKNFLERFIFLGVRRSPK